MEERNREKLVESVCEYPYILSNKASYKRSMSNARLLSNYASHYPLINQSKLINSSFESIRPSKHKKLKNIATGPTLKKDFERKFVLFKATKLLGGVSHSIEISISGT